ncbi:uncharacterized protein LOC134817972 isoform X4 [Bolinopsis microptera]|uniref:uncharacterized protein LOC134817972 isoform X4 n=1 Tax=Bolinopsis microptera TaxID=2820187 RepID=UPI0030797A23
MSGCLFQRTDSEEHHLTSPQPHQTQAWLAMGADNSTFQLEKGEAYLNYYCLTIRETNTIRVIHANKDVKNIIRKVIKCNWPPGITHELDEGGYWELKLKGTPFWNSFNSEYALRVHRLICLMIQELYAGGWEIIISSDLSRVRDLSTFFLKRPAIPIKDAANVHIFTVTLSGENLMYLTNIPKSTKHELIKILNENWGKGVKKETYCKSGIVVALGGKPWLDIKSMSAAARSLLHKMVNYLGMVGWELITTARVKNARDTLFFMKTRTAPAINDLVRSFFSLSINGKDKLRVLHSSIPSIIDDLRKIITDWEGEIISESIKNGSHEFEIKGNPFWCESTEAIQTRFLMIKILENLLEKGFRVQTAINPSSRLINKSLMIFRKGIPTHLQVICISFDENDRIRIMNAPEDFNNCVRSVIMERYGQRGIIKESTFRRAFDFKIRGQPWSGNNANDGIEARSMLCHLLQKVNMKGWRVVLSTDATSCAVKTDDRKDHPQDVQSWYLMKTDIVNRAVAKWKNPGISRTAS